MLKRFKVKIVLAFSLMILLSPFFALADSHGQAQTFFVDSTYDGKGREKVGGTLQKISQWGYFYLEDDWYQQLTEDEKTTLEKVLNDLAQEFDGVIYPKLTATFGDVWKPGIDNDEHITILFQQMKDEVAGYFRADDEYPRVQSEKSNEREMVYLNANYLGSQELKSYLAHEFVHLITFNQKDRLRAVSEEVWLNEARADYAPTLLGYDDEYQGSNLQKRVKVFIENPLDSLTEWRGEKADYGALNVFVQYLIEQYGINVLVESLHSSRVGIPSINQALKENNIEKEFSEIFSDWLIAVFLNDCRVGREYCYKNKNLKKIRITPSLILLPVTQKTEFSLDYKTSVWAGNWYRIMGGDERLDIKFQGALEGQFKVPYVLCDVTKSCSVGFLDLDASQAGELSFEDFSQRYISITLIPFSRAKTTGFDGQGPSYYFSIFVRSSPKNQSTNQGALNEDSRQREEEQKKRLLEELKTQIAKLQAQIATLRVKLAGILAKKSQQRVATPCKLETDLYLGKKNEQVRCLQEFLKSHEPALYPEGLVTGFFGPLTKKAVVRFQEKYAAEILFPLGLKKGTGFVGSSTRAKINQLYSINKLRR